MSPLRLCIPAVMVLAACAAAPLEISVLDAGSDVRLVQAQELFVRLPANPTTGYRWELRDFAGVVDRLGEPSYTRDASASGMTGVGGIETWRFAARRPGTQSLVFEYRRPWEQGIAPVRTVNFRVTVD